jgi:hypothetical protein
MAEQAKAEKPVEKSEAKQPVKEMPKKSLPTVEEHAKKQKVTAPILAAVMQKANWSSGKRVSREEFENAVKAFLSAPMGGRN